VLDRADAFRDAPVAWYSRQTRLLARGIGFLLAASFASLLLGGCAVRPVTPDLAHFEPDSGYRWDPRRVLPDNDPQTLFILTFSGGGTRAAAFAYGVLEELRSTTVKTSRGTASALSQIDLITGTSGGSFTALAYALYGAHLFDFYDKEFLKRDVEGELLQRLFNPLRWPQVLSQGFGRSELAEEYYDEILFHDATYGDLLKRETPVAVVGATDVTTGMRVDFSQPEFNVICGDLSRFRLSRAAAASSAVPIVLSPVTIDNRGGTCGFRPSGWMAGMGTASTERLLGNRMELRLRQLALLEDSRERPYIHLVDGGLSDNLGLYGIVQALQEVMANEDFRAAVIENGLRRIVIVVVNSRSAPSFGFDRDPDGPGTFALLMQSISVPIDRYSTEAIAALQDVITEWRLREKLDADARRLGQSIQPGTGVLPVEFSVIDVSFETVADPRLREYLENLPTSFALSDEAVDKLRETGAQLLRDSPAFQEFVKELQ
ncbi:MAG: patatin-like phospholipase family protein, partial [Burkholderiales bacterium]